MECLHENGKLLSGDCKHAMFNVKKSELMDSATDYTLVNACKSMLKQYCFDKDMDALECLKQHKDSLSFDKKCHYVIVNRLILQNQDYRFNPKLQEACSKNIAAYCTDIVMKEKRNEELNGAVVNCLKTKFREGKLNLNCTNQMTLVLQEQALNYKMNPLLQNLCKNEIKVLCARSDEDEDHGEVEECLKNAFLNRQIITKECKVEVATLIQESKADIHVDPLLQRACTIDLLKYCSQVVSGDGRRKFIKMTFYQEAFKIISVLKFNNVLLLYAYNFPNCRTEMPTSYPGGLVQDAGGGVPYEADAAYRDVQECGPINGGPRKPLRSLFPDGCFACQEVLPSHAPDLCRLRLHLRPVLWASH